MQPTPIDDGNMDEVGYIEDVVPEEAALGPTEARPGSEGKVVILEKRYAAGLPLWHADDRYIPDDPLDEEDDWDDDQEFFEQMARKKEKRPRGRPNGRKKKLLAEDHNAQAHGNGGVVDNFIVLIRQLQGR